MTVVRVNCNWCTQPKYCISHSRSRCLHVCVYRWTDTLFIFAMSFYLTWLAYAALYYLICWHHGDFDDHGDEEWTPCVLELEDFASAFLFSLETQHTIGYGSR